MILRIIIGALLVVAGLYYVGALDEFLYQFGLNFHPCVEYVSGKVVCE